MTPGEIDELKSRPGNSCAEVAKRLGVRLRPYVRELMGSCAICSTDLQSRTATRWQTKGRNGWVCAACRDGGDVIKLVKKALGLDFKGAVEWLGGTRTVDPQAEEASRKAREADQTKKAIAPKDEAARSEEAAHFWCEAVDPINTPVERYLEHRRVWRMLPEGAAGRAIRFHPWCKFGLKRVPCMLGLVRNIRTDVPQAIHRTALDLAGHKVSIGGLDRMSLGPVAGGAVKLTDDPDISICLGVGEGLESTLSVQSIPEFGASPVWSLLSAGGIAAFPVLAGIECLWIAVDHDEAGERAAATCAQRWTAAGQEVFRVRPKSSGDDLNDLIGTV
jgi:hypothetical protein